MKTFIYFLLFISFMFACSGSGKSTTQIECNELSNIIDLTAGFKNVQSVRLSEIADSVTFIPFETTQRSLMGMGQKNILFSSHYIFYYEKYFDWNGNYLGSIIKKGNGPFEEPEGGTLLFRDNHFYSKGSKLIEYDITGKPTGKVRNLYAAREFGLNDLLRRSGGLFFIEENFVAYDFPTTVYFINKNFEFVNSRIMTNVDSLQPVYQNIGESRFITYYNDEVFFYNFMNDTIFRLTDTYLEPRWVVTFDDLLKLPTQVILDSRKLVRDMLIAMRSNGSIENTELIQQTDNKHKVIAAYETKSHVFFLMTEIIMYAVPRGKTPPEPYIIYYNKNTGKTTRVNGKGFVDDILGMEFFFPQLGIFEEKLITYIWPFELFNYIKECRESGRDVNPKLLALSKQVKEDDNPILILVHLKK